MAQRVKNPPAMQEPRVHSLGWEDLLEKGMATHSSILVENPRDRRTWRATVHRVAESWTRLKQLSTHARLLTVCKVYSHSLLYLTLKTALQGR